MHVKRATDLADIDNNRFVRVAGVVLLRQKPSTANGITFVTLEDETGTMNLVMHHRTWKRYYKIARMSNAWVASGKIEKKHSVIHVLVSSLQDLSDQMKLETTQSRDYR